MVDTLAALDAVWTGYVQQGGQPAPVGGVGVPFDSLLALQRKGLVVIEGLRAALTPEGDRERRLLKGAGLRKVGPLEAAALGEDDLTRTIATALDRLDVGWVDVQDVIRKSGYSRVVVRRALDRLVVLGLVEYVEGSGVTRSRWRVVVGA